MNELIGNIILGIMTLMMCAGLLKLGLFAKNMYKHDQQKPIAK